jgi:vacuolar-type H+-ATPase subunit C/Vma6
METSYIYSASRVIALEQFLLSKTDIERLLVAEPGEDLHSALKETYLAPYVAHVPDEDVGLAIEQTLIDAKRLIHRISPNGDMFRVMWIQYDIHNLRVFVKATVNQLTLEECRPFLSERGVYNPEYLFTHAENGTLDFLQSEWQEAYTKALDKVKAGELDKVDGIFDELHFVTSKRIVNKVGDSFMKKYLVHFIDMYNLKSRLRYLKNDKVNFSPDFVCGGSFDKERIETLEETVAAFSRLGGAEFWRESLEYFQTKGKTTSLDARSGEYLLTLAKEGSADMFSSASLVLYYLKCRQAAANIRIIVVGKDSGLSETAIRTNLRMAYVND